MNMLSDDILNKYLDGELDEIKSAEVEEILNRSETDKKRFLALKLVHSKLPMIQEDEVSEDFTTRVMSQIGKKFVIPKQQKYFILSVSSFIILICIGIVAYIATNIISFSAPQTEPVQVTETVQRLTTGLIMELKKMFSGKNLSIIGSISSLAIIISGYFFFEHQKRVKENFGS